MTNSECNCPKCVGQMTAVRAGFYGGIPKWRMECDTCDYIGPIELEQVDAVAAATNNEKSMLRDRPYDGWPHTYHGARGQMLIHGITIRDLCDCYIRAVLLSAYPLVPELCGEALKGVNAKLCGNELFKFDLGEIDPLAIAQNLMCEIEKIMGVYPNIHGPSLHGHRYANEVRIGGGVIRDGSHHVVVVSDEHEHEHEHEHRRVRLDVAVRLLAANWSTGKYGISVEDCISEADRLIAANETVPVPGPTDSGNQ